jgi:hypothetical protein
VFAAFTGISSRVHTNNSRSSSNSFLSWSVMTRCACARSI